MSCSRRQLPHVLPVQFGRAFHLHERQKRRHHLMRRGAAHRHPLLYVEGEVRARRGAAAVQRGQRRPSDERALAAEESNVQAAIDAMMVNTGLGSLSTTNLVDTTGEATSNMGVFPYTDGSYALCPASGNKYIRGNTTGTYYVDADGTVHQQSYSP